MARGDGERGVVAACAAGSDIWRDENLGQAEGGGV